MNSNKYRKTVYACFIGYVVQAIVNNYLPLLFLTFRSTYGLPLEQITLITTINFSLQLIIDLLSAAFVDKIGYRTCAVTAHVSAALGFILLSFLPDIMPYPFAGILIAEFFCAIGGGLLETLISPIVESCPTDNKEKAMSLLHSFYCWGHVGVVALSTLFFAVFSIDNWRILALLWALVPAANAFLFTRVPLAPVVPEDVTGLTLGQLLRIPLFWIAFLLMVCAGASEQAVSQWASAFAEDALHVNKALGDLAGPMLFAILMGTSRLLYGHHGETMDLRRFMKMSCILCIFSYLLIVLAPFPWLSLIGCGICGFSVGILWPGTFSLSASSMPGGGTAMFALLALAGDLGCASGPSLVGIVSAAAGGTLKTGILAALVFPVAMFAGLYFLKNTSKSRHS